MSDVVISVEGLSKFYRLGEIGAGTLQEDFAAWWAQLRGKPDPRVKIGTGASRDDHWALRDVNFEVRQGDVLGIIGRNGAGKSTLLKILSRTTAPTQGRVRVRGRIASLLEVGTGFHPELSGRDNIFLNGAILGMKRAEIARKLDEIIDFSGVERFIDTPVKRYSSGMYVRLAFAVAAHLEPEILVVDEVLAVGDVDFQKKCMGKMQDVASHGRTVLFVSHQLASIAALTTSCLHMAKGRVDFAGATGAAIERYLGGGGSGALEYIRPPEAGAADVAIESVALRTSFPGNVQANGDPMEIRLRLSTRRPVERLCLSIQFFDSELVNHVHVWTHELSIQPADAAGGFDLTCTIPALRLYQGNYRLRIFVSGPPGGQHFETLEAVCPFEVTMGNRARLFQWWPKECSYLEDSRWELETRPITNGTTNRLVHDITNS